MEGNENIPLHRDDPQAARTPLSEFVHHDRSVPPGSRTGLILFLAEESTIRAFYTAEARREQEGDDDRVVLDENATRAAYETANDRLRFVSLFDIQELKVKYLATQNAWDRDALDRRNSATREPTFWEAAVQQFNNPNWIIQTEAMPALHAHFMDPIELTKGPYTLTVKKAKSMVQKMRPKIEKLNRNYEASGNGSNQRVPDSDEEQDQGSGSETTPVRNTGGPRGREWRRYDEEQAELIGGDDRGNFLGSECPSVLYWFHILDVHELIGFTCAELSNQSSARRTKKEECSCSSRTS
eukprot:scaffold4760_cov103-Cylindrotheca_fusiformis.AAC.3